jgi:hypothetical protein
MNSPTLAMNLPLPITRALPPRSRVATSRDLTSIHRSAATPSPTLDLARACAREASAGETLETASLLFFGACAATMLVGCGFHLERFLAHWDSFQNFVRTALG